MQPKSDKVNPYQSPKKPGLRGKPLGVFKNQIGRAHFVVFLVIWGFFTCWTGLIVGAGVDDGSDRLRLVIATTAGTILGPLTGAISRDMQSCCLEFSLWLLPYSGAFLLVGVLAQVVKWPFRRFSGVLRMLLWIVGWLGWFMGGIVSFAHALS